VAWTLRTEGAARKQHAEAIEVLLLAAPRAPAAARRAAPAAAGAGAASAGAARAAERAATAAAAAAGAAAPCRSFRIKQCTHPASAHVRARGQRRSPKPEPMGLGPARRLAPAAGQWLPP